MRFEWSRLRQTVLAIWLATLLSGLSIAAEESALSVAAEEGVWTLDWSARRTYDVVVQGSIAYVGSEGGFLVVDVLDPAAPEEIGSVELPGARLTAIAVSDSVAVAADDATDSLLVLDVGDGASPRLASRMDGWRKVYDVEIAGDIALIADVDGLSSVDVSDPTAPLRIAGPCLSRAHHVEVVGGTAYLSGFIYGLQVADVSRPTEPIEIGDTDHARFLGAAGMHVAGDVAYMVYRGGLMVVDVSEPQAPVELGFVGGLAADPGVVGYVEVSGEIACVLGGEGVSFVDVSKPSAPAEVGFVPIPIETTDFLGVWGSNLRLVHALGAGIDLVGRTALVAGVTDGLLVIDFSDPTDPLEIGRLWDSLGRGRDVAVVGRTAYVATTSDLLAVSLFDREAPFLLGSIDLPGEAHEIEVAGGYAYVTLNWLGLLVVDVRGPTKPRVVGLFPIECDEMGVAVERPIACVVDGARASVIDVSEPESPVLQAVIEERAYEAELFGNTLLLMTQEVGDDNRKYSLMRSFDLSDPGRPVALGTLEFGYRARLGRSGARVHVVDSQGLHEVDITHPALPLEVASSYRGESRSSIAVSETLACQTVGLQPLWIKMLCLTPDSVTHCFDVSDPSHPLPTGRIFPSVVRVVSGGFLYGTTDSSFWVADAGLLKTRWLSGVAVDPGRKTHLVLLNRWPTENEVEVSLATTNGAVSGRAVIPAGQQLVVELDGAAGREESGMIKVQPRLPILANAQVERTTGRSGTGRLTRALPEWHKCGCGWFGLDSGARGGPAEGWDRGIGWVVGLRQLDGLFATDLVLSNPDEPSDPDFVPPWADAGPAQDEVEITLFSTSGAQLARYRIEVDGGSIVVDPEPIARRADRPDLGWGYARINGRVLASALVRDLRTGDSAAVPMVRHPESRTDGAEVRPQWLDFVARTEGRLESCWRTDLVVLNLDEEEAQVDLNLHAPGRDSSAVLSVAGSTQAVFQDVAGLLGSGCKGMLEVRSDRPVVVSGRIYNQTVGGTAGHAIRARDVYSGLVSGESAWLPGLRQKKGRYRTNINFSNIGDEPARIGVTLFDATGTLLDGFIADVPSMRVVQDLEPFAQRGGRPDLGWGYAQVTVEQGTGVFVSASVINNLTNDSVTIEMQR